MPEKIPPQDENDAFELEKRRDALCVRIIALREAVKSTVANQERVSEKIGILDQRIQSIRDLEGIAIAEETLTGIEELVNSKKL